MNKKIIKHVFLYLIWIIKQSNDYMKNSISFFDFDGTLTHKDSMIEFIKFYKGRFKTYSGILFLSPFLAAMKIGLIHTQKGKEILLSYFFKGENIDIFNTKCEQFALNIIPSIFKKDGLLELKARLQQKQEVCIVTASAENWVTPYFEKMGIKVIGSQLQILDKKLTGKLIGNNCKGAEKVERIKKEYALSNFENILAYGDSSGDKEMLAIAKHKFYKHFTG